MARVDTTHDMHLGNIAITQLGSAGYNLINAHIPCIGIALATTKRTELAVEQADICGLDMDITIEEDHIATALALTFGGKLAENPQRSLAP